MWSSNARRWAALFMVCASALVLAGDVVLRGLRWQSRALGWAVLLYLSYRLLLRLSGRTVERVTDERLRKAQLQTVEALAVAINAKDSITADHVRRVQIYAEGVGQLMGCTKPELDALREGALLHDVGKIAVPDSVLTKESKLTDDEFQKMKLHTVVGAQILSRVDFPFPITAVVRSHHERWDGKGYPDGLQGTEIPLTARILSVVDCFDAVREDRHYRKGMSREEAIALIESGRGTQYDPDVVDVFLEHLPDFEKRVRAEPSWVLSDFGVEPVEPLRGAARDCHPAAGLASGEYKSDQRPQTDERREARP
jgi:putative nucleotidyltransferase with HDIG domain